MIPEYLDIPIFPLPNVTFFPQTVLPLHVFEPRYVEMVANCLRGDRLMGVALLREGWQQDYFGRPPIYRTFGVGKIVDHERLREGRYNITLEGLYRVRLIHEFPTDPYRSGRVQVLQDPPIDGARAQVGELMKTLRNETERLARLLPPVGETVQSAWAAHPHPLVVVNHLASGLVIDAYDRQSILEQDDPLRRIQLTAVQTHAVLHQLCAPQVHEPLAGEDI